MLLNQSFCHAVKADDRFFIGIDLFGNSLELYFLYEEIDICVCDDTENHRRTNGVKMKNEIAAKMANFILESVKPVNFDEEDFTRPRITRTELEKDFFGNTLEIDFEGKRMFDLAIYDDSRKRIKGIKVDEDTAVGIARLIVNRLAEKVEEKIL